MAEQGKKLKVGDWVEVRTKVEILATLDGKGEVDGMPFMPEMFAYCGRRFQVYKRAHKTCDTVFPVRGRRVHRTVHLDTRCDGKGHGGCQAGCLIFWKEAWLRPVDGGPNSQLRSEKQSNPVAEVSRKLTEADVRELAQSREPASDVPVYSCQATRLPYASTNLKWWDVRQYIEDYLSGNVGIRRLIAGLVYSTYYNLSQSRIGPERLMQRLYNLLCPIWGGPRWPRTRGTIEGGGQTPTASLNLQPGELVRVKSHSEILASVSTENKNRGMYWDAEMAPYCGKTYRVLARVTSIIDEKTGKMLEMKNPCIILDTVVCQSKYSSCRMFCPRSIYPYWREIWLERVN